MEKDFEIYFNDLSQEAKDRLCKAWGTSPEEENWETIPLAIISRETEENEEQQ